MSILVCVGWCAAVHAADAAAAKPNIILIFCDDLGYGDLGCFGSKKHRTPNIDRMAAEGTRFTDFYVTSGVCTPSRSSLMTGCYPRRVNMHQDARGGWVLFPIARKGLNPQEITVAEVLKGAGYATSAIGKWHLGDQSPFLPTKQGFDHYFGIPYSNDMGTRQRRPQPNPPLPLMRDETVIEAPADQTTLTKRYTAEAIRFITANQDGPFFLYLPHTFPHWPLFASEQFRGKSKNGGYGDAVEEIDWSTGQILATLQKLGIDDRTMVVFMSDNGAAQRHGGSNGPLRGFKGSTWDGGMRVPCVMRWPGQIPAGKVCRELAVSFDLMPTFARLAGTAPPTDRRIDGKDIRPLLFGAPDAKSPHDAFFYYRIAQLQAVRSGRYKLHLAGNKLYDLVAEIGEKTDVSADHPDVVQRLRGLADACREDLGDGKTSGANQRPAAFVDEPTPRTKPAA